MRRVLRAVCTVAAATAFGSLLPITSASAAGPIPDFRAPWPCGEVRDFYHHSSEVENALDFNISGPGDLGTPALASAPGTVVAAGVNGGYGNEVVIDHGGGWSSRVAHLDVIGVAVGPPVVLGQEVGKVGTTGNSTGPHLHYEQMADGGRVPITVDGIALPYSPDAAQHTSNNCAPPPPPPA